MARAAIETFGAHRAARKVPCSVQSIYKVASGFDGCLAITVQAVAYSAPRFSELGEEMGK